MVITFQERPWWLRGMRIVERGEARRGGWRVVSGGGVSGAFGRGRGRIEIFEKFWTRRIAKSIKRVHGEVAD